LWAAVGWAFALVGVVTAVAVLSVLVAAIVSGAGMPTGWDQVGQAFGVVNGVFSALALMIVGITLWVQFRELRMQRDELRLQREAMVQSQEELRRSAEASMRALHLELIRMAINDAELAMLWPELAPNVPAERSRQFLYANLILQHHDMIARVGDRSRDQVRASVRFSFMNPIVREYWVASASARRAVNVPGSPTSEFDELCEEVYQELEGGLNGPPDAAGPEYRP
jgi:uncharacterized membrane protein